MKKVGLGILIAILALTFSGVIVIARAVTPQEKGKANAPDLEKIEFIHYKKNFAKQNGKAPKQSSCYKFLSPRKVRWTSLLVSYVINPINPQGLDGGFITSAFFNSAETWDEAVINKELINNTYITDTTVAYGVQDYKNAITFGNYPTKGVIAVTTVWYNPALRSIAEFDIMFDTDFVWGDATVDSSKMDLQNIATHELGHGVGLSDVYETNCSAVTMYGYSTEGETDKRTLETPDITGLRTLYP